MLTLFTRSFDTKYSLVIWDFIIVKGDKIFLKLYYSILREIYKNFADLDTNQLYKEIKNLIIQKKEKIVLGLIDNIVTVEKDFPIFRKKHNK